MIFNISKKIKIRHIRRDMQKTLKMEKKKDYDIV